ncbi:MAG: 4Fe-4S binding protein [Methanomassiliicoccus sp.]|nr:4Fe-4S binding protein [Methanomassiliicoccus sp.]
MASIMKGSTKAMMDEVKANDKSMSSAMHGWIYAKYTWQYLWSMYNIRLKYAGQAGKEKWAQHYHSKVLTFDQARSIIDLDHDIPLRDLEKVVPYETAREFLVKAPAEVVLYECACRRATGGKERGCQPSQVCMVIGKPFTDFILEAHPDLTRRVTKEEALQLLKEEDERGHIHTAWFKDAMLDRFYSICNCCKCHCIGIKAMKEFGAQMIAPSGYSASVDAELCNSCGKCAEVCAFDAIVADKKTVVYDVAKCMGCGACVTLCPTNARKLVRDESKGIPLDVSTMDRQVMEQPRKV